MKNIKYAFVVLAAVLSAASCTKEIEPELGNNDEKGNMIINAVAGSLGKSDPETKTHGVFGYDVVWDTNDQIAVIDGSNNQGLFNLIDGVGETLGKFQQATGTTLSGTVTGYSPASLLQEDGTLFWPAEQTYSKELTGIPMTASATVAEEGGTNFNFKNLGGVLQLVLTSEVGNLTMKSITVSASNAGMSGAFSIADGAATGFTSGTSITLNCAGLTIGTAAKTVNIAIPAGNYTDMQLSFMTTDGRVKTLTSSSLSIKRNVVSKVTLALNGFERVFPAYFCVTAVEGDAQIGMRKTGTPNTIEFEYSFHPENGEWYDFTADNSKDGVQTLVNLPKGETVYLRGNSLRMGLNKSNSDHWSFDFSGAGKACAGGNVMSLLDPEVKSVKVGDYAFYGLFYGCSSLTQAPELPATTLDYDCYRNMFKGCSRLTQAPELPATSLADNCYSDMFSGCSSLTQAPELPATTLASGCYCNMFDGCSSLTQAPELPATTLADYCYGYMFFDCSRLTQAPELPATTLDYACYFRMFDGCYSLSSIKVAFTDWNGDCTSYWLYGVSSAGTFYCPRDLDVSTRDKSHIPAGWEVRYTSLSDNPEVGEKVWIDGIEAMYIGISGDRRIAVTTMNMGASTKYDKGTAYSRAQLVDLDIPSGWELPNKDDMALLAGLGFTNDSTNDGAYNSTYDFFIPYTQDVSDSKREGRLWVVGGTDNDFYWFRSDNAYGLTTTATANPNYYVRLVKVISFVDPEPEP